MSDASHQHHHGHTGPIKTPKQLLVAVLFSFIVPVFAIIALVAYVASDTKPAGSNQIEKYALGGLTAQDLERGVNERLRKVGTVEIRDANRPLKAGQDVYTAQCAVCHATGAANAPKFGDAPSWANRLKTGFDALVQSALKGKGAMSPQGGGDHEDLEIARAVHYMANAAGGSFPSPQAAAPAAMAAASAPAGVAAPAAAVTPVAMAAPAAAPAPVAAPAAAAAPVQVAAAGSGQALFQQSCQICHGATSAIPNSPKIGDKAAWAPRLAQGVPVLVQNAIKGKGAMPPKGGSAAPDADIKAAVEYMVGTVR